MVAPPMRAGRTFVFLHGGPGFDSTSARLLLKPHLLERGHACSFWDEPSPLRPQGERFEPARAYERWLASAERFTLAAANDGPVHVLTHSFTVHAGLELARRHPTRISGLVGMAPAADAFQVYCSVLRIAARDFDEAGDARADAIRSCLRETTMVMDEPMQQACSLAATDERLFQHYWVNTAARELAADAYGGGSGFDMESFLAVLSDYRDRHQELHTLAQVTQPVLAIFGEGDVVSPRSEHLPALEASAPRTEAITISGTGHYVHLEAPGAVIDAIEDWIVRTQPAA